MKTINISKGNSKMGAIPSVSLPACITCNPDAPCFKKCYARRLNRYTNVKNAYQNNLDLLNEDWMEYWRQLREQVKTARFFRYHVSGDIPNKGYFKEMVITACKNPNTQFLAFTKQYDIVNNYIDIVGGLPNNLKIIFSNWGDWKCKNPYNLPQCEIIFKGQEIPENYKLCGGNCTDCACRGVGCWELKNGEIIAIKEH